MSKSKGNAYERKICCELSLWWSKGKRDDLFWRTAGSGKRATDRAKLSKNTVNSHGDIAATDPIAQPLVDLITFEIKRGYNKFTIQDLMDKPEKAAEQRYEGWFRKVQNSAELAGTPYWMVIAQRDRREPLIFIPEELQDWLNLYDCRRQLILETKEFSICCTLFSEFLQLNPRDFEKAMRK